jgi:probable HAF family extracellular repeat protein
MIAFWPRLLRCAFAVGLFSFLFPGIVANVQAGSLSYKVIDLGGLDGVSNAGFVSEAFGLNASGQVVGDSNLSNGTLGAFSTGPGGQPINNLGGDGSSAKAINDSGQATGDSVFGSTLSAFRTSPDGTITSGSNLGLLAGGSFSIGEGINASGQVVGQADTTTPNGTQTHAFRTTSTGGLNAASDLGVLPGMTSSQAFGINQSGQAVGVSGNSNTGAQVAFRADPGSSALTSLGLLSGGSFSTALAINASAMVVGNADTSSAAEVAYRTTAGGNLSTATILGLLQGGSFSSAQGINDAGWVVGVGDTSSSSQDAWVWNGSGSLIDLNSVLVNGQGWDLFSATGINDAGWIAGIGEFNGQTEAFLLEPVPEPGALFMASTGVVLGLVLAWRRRQATIA